MGTGDQGSESGEGQNWRMREGRGGIERPCLARLCFCSPDMMNGLQIAMHSSVETALLCTFCLL